MLKPKIPRAAGLRLERFGRRKREPGAHEGREDVLIASQPLVGMREQEAEEYLGDILGARLGGISHLKLEGPHHHRSGAAHGVRQFLSNKGDSGYWDFFKFSTDFWLSITDAQYGVNTWVHVEGAEFFKLRLILAGSLHCESGDIIARAAEALLYVSPGVTRSSYSVLAAQPLKMVVLHGKRELLTEMLGLPAAEVPPPLDSLFDRNSEAQNVRIPLNTGIVRAVELMVESRHQMMPRLRGRYLEALSMAILLQIIEEFRNRAIVNRAPVGIRAGDLSRIYEARDYLTQHYRHPPKILDLARMVGLNQTKLKSEFREVMRITIFGYIIKCRMERAAELLRAGGYGISEVAYEVGYEYPANFTAAFKRYFGKLPRGVARRRIPAQQN